MFKAGLAVLLLAWPFAVLAQPQLEILSPNPGACVNNGGVVFEGGVVGGEVQPPALNVGTRLRLGDAQARPITLDMTLGTPTPSGVSPTPTACVDDAQCAAGGDGQCFPSGQCGCFIDADCGAGVRCVDNVCGCSDDAECGANGRCLDDGRCGCGDDAACAAGESCGMNGICSCDQDAQCPDGQVCAMGQCGELDNVVEFSALYTPDDGNLQETDLYSFNGDSVIDASTKLLIVRATAGGETVEDRVSFQLDRKVPRIDFDQVFLASLGDCQPAPDLGGDLPGVIVDEQDPNPRLVSIEQEAEGCTLTQRLEVADACGNAQALRISTTAPPAPGEVQLTLNAYRCGLDGCDLDAESQIEDGDRIGRGALGYAIDAPQGCFNEVSATYTVEGGDSRIIIPGQTLETTPAQLRVPIGPYALADGGTLEVAVDGNEAQTVTFSADAFADINVATTQEVIRAINRQLEGAIADVELGLVLRTLSRGAAAQLEITGGTQLRAFGLFVGASAQGDGDGAYAASVQVFACGNDVPVAEGTIGFTILDRPVADAGGPYTARQGEVIQLSAEGSFAADELGGIVEYAWDLDADGQFDVIGDDGVITTAFDTAETGDGEFRVLLRITAGNGTVEFATASVIVEDVSPTCDLGNAGMPYVGTEGELVDFDASASVVGHPTDPIIAFDWQFGDNLFPQRGGGLSQTGHVYQEAGQFTVTLRVEDTDSFTECQRVVNIDDVAPEIRGAGAFDDQNLLEGQPVRFFVEAAPGSPSDAIQLISWNFGDGSQPINEGVNRNPQHAYADDTGNRPAYNVCVQVADEDDQIEECFEISIIDLQPLPAINGQQVGNEGEVFFFDVTNTIGGGAADPLDRIEIDFGDGTPAHVIRNINDPAARLVQHRVLRSGALQVQACAFDEDSSACDTLDVDVRDVIPRARAEAVYDNPQRTGFEGVPLQFDASASEPGSDTDPIVSYRWDFGDGSVVAPTDQPTTSHAFPNQGTYPVLVTAVDSDGSTNSVNLTVSIANVGPERARIISDPQFEIGQTARFRVEYDDVEADIPPEAIEWFVDGRSVSENLELTTTFGNMGEVTVSVVVTDDGGETTEAETTVQITAAAPQIADIGEQSGREGQPMVFEVEVRPALLDDEGNLDAPVRIVTPVVPDGAEIELIEHVEPINDQDTVVLTTVRVTWTPTFYDAGEHVLRIRAEGRFNEVNRTRDIPIRISESGSPLLAASGGTGRRGQVTLYDYGREAGVITFSARARIDVGIGASGLAHDPAGRFVYTATPGTGGVAVVSTHESRLVRVVPTGNGTNGVAYGDDYIWAINSATNELIAVDATTLKVDTRVSLAPMERPRDILWLPAGFADLDAPRLAVVGARSGDLVIVDPDAVLDGDAPIVARGVIGGVLTRVVGDADTGHLIIADGKTRTVYDVDLADFLNAPAQLDPNSEGLSFAPYDLFAANGEWWAATDAGLVAFAAGDTTVNSNLDARAVAALPTAIVADGSLVVATEDRVRNLTAELDQLVDAAGGRVRRLAAFVAFE